MGACASSFKVLKNSSDAQPPPPKEEVAADAAAEMEMNVNKDLLTVEDEANRQSLGQMFKEDERKILISDAKEEAQIPSDCPKFEFAEEKKTEDVKAECPSLETEASHKKETQPELKPIENLEDKGVIYHQKTVESDEKKPEVDKTEEQKPASDRPQTCEG